MSCSLQILAQNSQLNPGFYFCYEEQKLLAVTCRLDSQIDVRFFTVCPVLITNILKYRLTAFVLRAQPSYARCEENVIQHD